MVNRKAALMAKWIKKNIWYMILLVLSMAALAIFGSSYLRSGTNERRVTAIETAQAGTNENIRGLERAIDRGFDNLSAQIKAGDEATGKTLEHNQSLIQTLLERD